MINIEIQISKMASEKHVASLIFSGGVEVVQGFVKTLLRFSTRVGISVVTQRFKKRKN